MSHRDGRRRPPRRRRTPNLAERSSPNEILEFCGDEPSFCKGDGYAGPGWYAHHGDYPDEGALFVGTDEDMGRLAEVAFHKLAAMARESEDRAMAAARERGECWTCGYAPCACDQS